MYRRKREDTRVDTIERRYGVNLNARGDMLLGNLLDERGFDSQHQILEAFHGRLTYHARKRRLFLSFHAEDKQQVQGFRLMAYNDNVAMDFYDGSLQEPVDSENASYVKIVIREKIRRASVVVCLIGNGTAWRDWVDWELQTAASLHKGICGVRLKDSRGRTPPLLSRIGAPVARWNLTEIISSIESAAARRT